MIDKKTKKNDVEELDLEDTDEVAPPIPKLPDYSLVIDSDDFRTIKIKGEYHTYISTPIGAQHLYVPIVSLIRALEPTDKINIYFNSPGGRATTAAQLIHAILECKGKTVAIIDADCMSAAPLIALACEELIINPYALIMFHDTAGGVSEGKTSAVLAQQDGYMVWYRNLLRKTAGKLLTEQEINELLNGKDFYFTQKEALKRLRRK